MATELETVMIIDEIMVVVVNNYRRRYLIFHESDSKVSIMDNSLK